MRIQNALTSALKQLETGFDLKLTQLQDSYLAELEARIKVIRAAKKEVEFYTVAWAKLQHESVQRVSDTYTNHFLDKSICARHEVPAERALRIVMNLCDEAIEKSWFYAGDIYKTINSEMTRSGIPGKNRFDYNDIKQLMDKIVDEIRQLLTSLIATESHSSFEQFIIDGRKTIAERFQAPFKEMVHKITKWKMTVVDRANRVQQSEEFQVLMTKMKAAVDKNVQEINERLTNGFSWCSQVKLDQASTVIDCLTKDANSISNTIKYTLGTEKTVELLSAVNEELESMGQ